MIKYSIVIPTYNHCDKFLKPCISAVLSYSTIDDIEIIISANGCTDNTLDYLGKLQDDFNYLGYGNHLKIVWNKSPIGYARATNEGIKVSTGEKVILLNNDAILLPQKRNDWLCLLEKGFTDYEDCGISCSLKKYSEITNMEFGVFFCAMLSRKLINEIGLLDEQFEIGGNEDIDYCARAHLKNYKIIQPVAMDWNPEVNIHVGNFPLWHQGEGTVHDTSLISGWERNFRINELKLALKYNTEWYEKYKDTV